MSMTSKVNPTLRQQIVDVFKAQGGRGVSNNTLLAQFPQYSRRALQEATQKLAREGVLVKSVFHRGVYYASLAIQAAAATASGTRSIG